MHNTLTPGKLVFRVCVGLVVLMAAMFLCCLVGPGSVSIEKLFEVGADGLNSDQEVFVYFRAPRVVLAAVIGAALACSGVVFQALLRNPLADPYILGISSGAGLGAILAVISGISWSFAYGSAISTFAFVGALGTVWLVWFIGNVSGRSNMTALLLAGVVVNAFFSAVIMFFTSIAKSSQLQTTIFWLMGNLNMAALIDFRILWFTFYIIVVGIGVLYYLAPRLNIISFGTEDALTAGINIKQTQTIAFAVAALITAISVSFSGLIGFVGLIVPHGVRLVFGPDHRQLIPLSAITGAIFLIVSDAVARVILAPSEMPVGVVTAIAGGPFFIILLLKYTRRIGWGSK